MAAALESRTGAEPDDTDALDPTPRRPRIPFAYCRRQGVLVHEAQADHTELWFLDSTDPMALSEVLRTLGSRPRLVKVDARRFEAELREQQHSESAHAMQEMEGIDADEGLTDLAELIPEPEDLMESADDAPIIRLINAVLTEAVKEHASDVHIEPFEDRLRVRFRVDGVLREVLAPKRALAPLVVSRIKVMAKLDIAEKRLPQDGRISLRVAGRAVDLRVSTLPSGHGERVVMRLLDKHSERFEFSRLGLDANDTARLKQLIRRPHGILLVTGPTGSGKTTTLYTALTLLNEQSRSIMTIEDPIEYFLDGISQTAVNPRIDMSFARGLRAILRQDPDVVMVGEIRDLETARIGVQSSLTGHLVLSTLHTNTAVGAVTRLADMGIEPFLLASSLNGVLAQRLVRRLCTDCAEAYEADAATLAALDQPTADTPVTLYRAAGCEQCHHSGYRGRVGIFELIEIDEALREAIHDGANEQQLKRLARRQGISIREAGNRLAVDGVTTVDEVVRVTREA